MVRPFSEESPFMQTDFRKLTALLPTALVVGLCRCGPVGQLGKAPGTSGTVIGLLLYTVLFFPLGWLAELLLAFVLVLISIPLCGEGERRLGQRDPGEIILDEVVAVPLCFVGLKGAMLATGSIWAYMLAGFALFRLFDILKPFGIKRLQYLPGGLGVVADDVAAALATNIILQIVVACLSLVYKC